LYSTALLVTSFMRIVGGACIVAGIVLAAMSGQPGGVPGMLTPFVCVTGGVLP